MKKILVLILFFAFLFSLHAQQTKGVSVAPASQKTAEGKTYALIAGISKYKNPAIPSLQFADKDAFAFYEYLKATGVDSNNIILLLNENAKSGEIWTNVDYITSLAKKGDKVFIYFSGHGDMESRIITQDAYLLPYDAPKVVYASGAISILLLKGYLATLSSNGVQVIFIADACHSGNLAGGREGMEATATVLKDKWKDEVKILSCQPGELSLEGKQWGNGRGLFSYELINGMAGLADKDKDGKVSLYELNLYLSEKVHEGAIPMPQHPMVFGDMESVVSTVDTKILSKINWGQSQTFAAIDVRGFDESLIAKLNDSIKYYYKKFKEYLDKGIYYNPGEDDVPTAYYYLIRIPENEQTHLLISLMKRNLCASIMNDVSEAIDLFVQDRLEQMPARQMKMGSSMELLRKILGDEKLLSLGYLPKVLAMQAIHNRHNVKVKAFIDKAIETDSKAAYLYFFRAMYYRYIVEPGIPESAVSDIKKSIELSPRFTYAYAGLIKLYLEINQLDSAYLYSNKLLEFKDAKTRFQAFRNLSDIFNKKGMKDSADHYLKMMMNLSDTSNDYFFLKYVGENFYEDKNYPLAIKYCLKAEHLDAEDPVLLYDLACSYSLSKDKNNALKYLERVFKKATIDDYGHIQRTRALDNIRNTPEFKALMKKYFPERFKK
ncbi:MAG: caspase family protein [Bacteroidia bacterium]